MKNSTVTRALELAACLLAAWTPALFIHLTAQHTPTDSVMAWVGLDVVELLALTALVHAAPRRAAHTRVTGLAAAALFVLDATVDTASATTTHGLVTAVIMAVCGEIPVALGCLRLALSHHPASVSPPMADAAV